MKEKTSFSSILNDVRTVGVMIAAIVGFFVWINIQLVNLNNKIDIIQTNELVHLKADIARLEAQITEINNEHKSLDQTLVRIQTILEEKQ